MNHLYDKVVVRQLDQSMIQDHVSSAYELMTRASQSVLDIILERFPSIHRLIIFCGQGNNAGDGYVLARLAANKDIDIVVISLVEISQLSGDALTACQDWKQHGPISFDSSNLEIQTTDLIVDAILGTGLNRRLNGQWNETIELINQYTNTPVVAIDIPSGLDSNTGRLWGNTIKADITITFIANKLGMYTGQARDYCGEIIFSSLGVPDSLYQQYASSANLLDWEQLHKQIKPRLASSHKGSFGNVLIIGGNSSMSGSMVLAGQAALRSGAGLVKIITHSEHTLAIQANSPELMIIGISDGDGDDFALDSILSWADTIAIGPGLGTNQWAKTLLEKTLNYLAEHTQIPLVLDADALNLLAQHSDYSQQAISLDKVVMTPHPAEAARLSNKTITQIENDRYESIKQIQHDYGASIILKGAGTLIASSSEVSVCPYGNAGMATAGMGDCLTGILASLIAQGYSIPLASKIAVCLHAKSGDKAAKKGQYGLIASDILLEIRNHLP
jgi:ADP-dependent NAD(P)H-hydrate dehydratase / NAD(P)H-hydrate epimerase